MIRATEKPFEEIRKSVKSAKKVFVVACDTCVAICHAGGKKQADILGQKISIDSGNAKVKVSVKSVMRQCELECNADLKDDVNSADVIVSTACGVGVQALAEMYPVKKIVPALNTLFMGAPVKSWVYMERCVGCGNCILEETGGLCPVSRCAKSLFNGPCGGSMGGKCEVGADVPCVWQEIIDIMRLKGRAAELAGNIPSRDWTSSVSSSPRTIKRTELNS